MSEKGKWLALQAYWQGRTVSSEIKLWSRQQLESAYVQRELQLKSALKVIAELRRENAQTNPPGT